MSKILYVSSPIQAVLMSEIFIPELINGFWKNHRPAGHGDGWRDVQVKVSEDGNLGPVGFKPVRNYNFLNLDFVLPNEALLVSTAQKAKASANFKSIKKELIELSHIVGLRLVTRDSPLIKLFRGNHKPGTITFSSSKARQASAIMVSAVATSKIVDKPTVKKTVVKKIINNVTRVPVSTVTE
jgi:hypothetical protein